MLELALLNIEGKKVKDINLNQDIWGITPNDAVLHNALILASASLRQGTHDSKTRDEVSGGGRKPHAQKGTGRARAGSIRAPHWKGGGVVFGPTPREYGKKMNKKERKLAVRSALAYKLLNSELVGLDTLELANAKTKDMIQVVSNLKLEGKVIFVISGEKENAVLATRNMTNVRVMDVAKVGILDITNCDYLVVEESAIKKFEEVLL